MKVSEKPCLNNTVILRNSNVTITNHQQGLRLHNPTSMDIRYNIFTITAQLIEQGEIIGGQVKHLGLKPGVYLLGIENNNHKKTTFSRHQVY